MENIKRLLGTIGLSPYEIQAYLALLKAGSSMTPYKLGSISGVSSGRIYDVVEKLVNKGLVAIQPGKPRHVVAIDPKIAIRAIVAKRERDWEVIKEQIENQVENLSKESLSSDAVSLIRSHNTYRWSILDLLDRTQKEHLSIVGGLTAESDGKAPLVDAGKRLANRGAVQRMIIPPTSSNSKYAKILVDSGVKLKEFPIDGIRFHLVDDKLCMLTVVDPKLDGRTTLRVESEIFGSAMRKIFEALWEKAKPLT